MFNKIVVVSSLAFMTLGAISQEKKFKAQYLANQKKVKSELISMINVLNSKKDDKK